jgi:Xaa-Pro aminopeptidase
VTGANPVVFARVLDSMAEREIDVMILGREAHARAVAGTNRLWLAGTRPFAPGCVVVRGTRAVHVLANSDDAVQPGFPPERLFGITWNPAKMLAALAGMPGVLDARRIAVDGMTPMMRGLLEQVAPRADLVDAEPVFEELNAAPDAARVSGVRAAIEVARAGLDAMAAALRPRMHARVLRGVCAEAFASFGVTTPAFEAVAFRLGESSSTWVSSERAFAEHDLVVMRAGALRDGWEASLARTYRVVAGAAAAAQPPPGEWAVFVDACRAGTTAAVLRGQGVLVHGVGRGVEPWPDVVLAPGMMVALELRSEHGVHQDIVEIT